MKKIITVLFAVLAMSSMFAYMPNKKNDWIGDNTDYLTSSCFIQEYVPEGYEDTVYLFCPGDSSTATINTQKPYLIKCKDRQSSRKIFTVLMVLMVLMSLVIVATSMFAETKVSDLFPSGGKTKTLFKNKIEERVAYHNRK